MLATNHFEHLAALKMLASYEIYFSSLFFCIPLERKNSLDLVWIAFLAFSLFSNFFPQAVISLLSLASCSHLLPNILNVIATITC